MSPSFPANGLSTGSRGGADGTLKHRATQRLLKSNQDSQLPSSNAGSCGVCHSSLNEPGSSHHLLQSANSSQQFKRVAHLVQWQAGQAQPMTKRVETEEAMLA